MPTGLEIYNESGAVVLSATEKYAKVLGTFIANAPGSLSNAYLSTGIAYATTTIVGNTGYFGVGLYVTFNGNTMSWTWPENGIKMPTVITYGVC